MIDEKGMLTDDLKQSILKAEKLVDVEDFYRPFKEKKKTKATEAIAKGLQGLSNFFMYLSEDDPKEEAKKYVNDDVKTVEEALEGAMHILSEFVSDDPDYRKALREMMRDGEIKSMVKKGIEDERQTYLMYYEYQEKIKHIKPHRVLALNRGESEKILTVKIEADKDAMSKHIETSLIKNTDSPSAAYIKLAIEDSIKRLIYPSLEREVRAELSEVAEDQAIEVFAENLNKLLLQPPLKGKMILGVDPAFRTGCKLSVVDQTGNVLTKGVIYPHEKSKGSVAADKDIDQSKTTLFQMIKKYHIELIAIGNGTASRETESFVSELIKEFKLPVNYVIVNEAGASVYSASELAREEFPDFSVEER